MALEIISEKGVDFDTLTHVFERYSWSASIDGDGDLAVQLGEQVVVYVSLQENVKLLNYMMQMPFREDASLESKLALVNRMNTTAAIGRFGIPEPAPNMLTVDYCLPYSEGIITSHTTLAVGQFVLSVKAAIEAWDKNGLIITKLVDT